MSTGTILALLLTFNSMGTSKKDLKELAREAAKLPKEQAIEMLAVAYVESTLRPGVVSSHGCVCWLQQQCGEKHKKPSCRKMVRTKTCVAGFLEDMKYWKKHCGEAYLEVYSQGWSACIDSPYWEKHKDDPDKRWCKGEDCTDYSRKVHKAEKEFMQWLRNRPPKQTGRKP